MTDIRDRVKALFSSPKPVTYKFLGVVVQEMAAAHNELVAEVEKLKARTFADSYRGTFADGESYARGDLVTHAGSLFLCLSDTTARPGDGDDWQLAVKRGRDGR